MNSEELKDFVLDLACPMAESLGLRLWGLEIKSGPRLFVRVYVDLPWSDAASGEDAAASAAMSASIDQCEEISRRLGLALDVAERIKCPWVLEVSSPGLERIFFELEQMRPYVGDMIEARLNDVRALDNGGRKTFRGKLLAVADDSFDILPAAIDAEGGIRPENLPSLRLFWNDVKRVSRIHIFNTPRKPGKGPRRGSA